MTVRFGLDPPSNCNFREMILEADLEVQEDLDHDPDRTRDDLQVDLAHEVTGFKYLTVPKFTPCDDIHTVNNWLLFILNLLSQCSTL